jgi:hypothetical protein
MGPGGTDTGGTGTGTGGTDTGGTDTGGTDTGESYADTAGTADARDSVTGAKETFTALGNTASTAEASTQQGYVEPTTALAAIGVEDGQEYNTPETQVAKQLEGLMGRDSALSQQSRRRTREGASALGMMSSSTAVGDAQARNVEALTPVAMKDAEIASQFKLQQQQTENKIKEVQVEAEVSGALTVQKAAIAERATRVAQEWQALFKAADVEGQASIVELQAALNKEQRLLEGDLQKELNQADIDAGMEQLIMNRVAESSNNFNAGIQTLMGNETWIEMFNNPDQTPEENNADMRSWINDLYQSSVVAPAKFQARAAGIYGEAGGSGLYDYIEDLGYSWE